MKGEEDIEERICIMKNNWACFLGDKIEQGWANEDEKHTASQLINYIGKYQLGFPTNSASFQRTIGTVKRQIAGQLPSSTPQT
jgi:hypothetical protein